MRPWEPITTCDGYGTMDTKKEKNGTSCKEKESQLDGEEWVKNHIPMLLLYMHVDTRVNYETRKNEALFSIL